MGRGSGRRQVAVGKLVAQRNSAECLKFVCGYGKVV